MSFWFNRVIGHLFEFLNASLPSDLDRLFFRGCRSCRDLTLRSHAHIIIIKDLHALVEAIVEILLCTPLLLFKHL